MPGLHPRILEECFSHLIQNKTKNEATISSFITYLLLQYQMVEQDKDGDYDAGDQGNAPHLKERMKIRWNLRTLDHWDLYRIRLR